MSGKAKVVLSFLLAAVFLLPQAPYAATGDTEVQGTDAGQGIEPSINVVPGDAESLAPLNTENLVRSRLDLNSGEILPTQEALPPSVKKTIVKPARASAHASVRTAAVSPAATINRPASTLIQSPSQTASQETSAQVNNVSQGEAVSAPAIRTQTPAQAGSHAPHKTLLQTLSAAIPDLSKSGGADQAAGAEADFENRAQLGSEAPSAIEPGATINAAHGAGKIAANETPVNSNPALKPSENNSQIAPDLLKLGRELRSGNIDPRETNIPEFAALIPEHIAFAKSAIERQGVEQDRLETLKQFEQEANQYALDKKVSYVYWHDLNLRLSILMTPSNKRNMRFQPLNLALYYVLLHNKAWLTEAAFREFTSKYPSWDIAKDFPNLIMIPVIDGVLKIKDQNILFGSDINVVGLIGDVTVADGHEIGPDVYFMHDEAHAYTIFTKSKLNAADKERVQEEYLAYRDSLSGKRRWAFEVGYWLATHELFLAGGMLHNPMTTLSSGGFYSRGELRTRLRDIQNWYPGLVSKAARSSAKEIGAYIKKMDDELKIFFKRLRPKTKLNGFLYKIGF